MEFCVGDRVRAISKSLIAKVGESNIGTVAAVEGDIGVAWDEAFGGHTLHGYCEDGHGWWCLRRHITLVEEDYDFMPATDEELSFLYS